MFVNGIYGGYQHYYICISLLSTYISVPTEIKNIYHTVKVFENLQHFLRPSELCTELITTLAQTYSQAT